MFRAIVVGLCAALVLTAGVGTAVTWPIDDTLDDPHVVVVLGGAGAERAELGIALADRYDVPLVLSSSASHFASELGRSCESPATLCIDPRPENTTGEAQNVAALADARGWEQVAVVTTEFHTARSRLLFRQCLGDRVDVVGATRESRLPLRQRIIEVVGYLVGTTIRRAC